MKKRLFLIIWVIFFNSLAIGQLVSTLNIEFENPARMSMEIDRSSVSVELPPNDAGSPLAFSNPVTVRIKSNVPWVLTATVYSDFLGLVNPVNSIPANQLEFKSRLIGSTENVYDLQEDYLGFVKNQGMIVARGSATPNEGLNILSEYRLKVNLKDPAGKFSLPIIFTLNTSQ